MGPSILNDKFSQTPKLAEHGTELRLGTTIQKRGHTVLGSQQKNKTTRKTKKGEGGGYAAGAAQALKV